VISNVGNQIHSIYTLYMENDLKHVRDRTEEQVNEFRAKLGTESQTLDQLRAENVQMQNIIRLYKGKIEKEMSAQKGGEKPFANHRMKVLQAQESVITIS
jgi:hypothetical protein